MMFLGRILDSEKWFLDTASQGVIHGNALQYIPKGILKTFRKRYNSFSLKIYHNGTFSMAAIAFTMTKGPQWSKSFESSALKQIIACSAQHQCTCKTFGRTWWAHDSSSLLKISIWGLCHSACIFSRNLEGSVTTFNKGSCIKIIYLNQKYRFPPSTMLWCTCERIFRHLLLHISNKFKPKIFLSKIWGVKVSCKLCCQDCDMNSAQTTTQSGAAVRGASFYSRYCYTALTRFIFNL